MGYMPPISGKWVGTITGTNAGTVVVDIIEDDASGRVRGHARIDDFRSGLTMYEISGTTDRIQVELRLEPLDQPSGNFVAGRVHVRGQIDDGFAGYWRSEVGTQGAFHLVRSSELPEIPAGRVFLVHGHDQEAKESVARFIERLGLKVVVLSEEPSEGRTIIEKFEHHADVDFALVLITPDDVGSSVADPKSAAFRARQNVILELGYFIARLSRRRVCALYKDGVELPSDYHGVCYVRLDSEGAWRMALARELKGAGLAIDLERVLRS